VEDGYDHNKANNENPSDRKLAFFSVCHPVMLLSSFLFSLVYFSIR